MGREAAPFIHPMEQPVIPDFALHNRLGISPVPGGEAFWPSLPFPPVFNPALGFTWATKTPMSVPTFHALLSQYVFSGGGPFHPNLMGQAQEESRSSSPVEGASSPQMSPTRALENLRLREQKHLRAES